MGAVSVQTKIQRGKLEIEMKSGLGEMEEGKTRGRICGRERTLTAQHCRTTRTGVWRGVSCFWALRGLLCAREARLALVGSRGGRESRGDRHEEGKRRREERRMDERTHFAQASAPETIFCILWAS